MKQTCTLCQKCLQNPRFTLTISIASNTHLNNKKTYATTWIYLLEVNLARIMKSKPSALLSQFFLANIRIESRTHCALYSGEDDVAIYIGITVATGVGDATMPVAYEDHSSNGPMR
jgi:hypothetical protein